MIGLLIYIAISLAFGVFFCFGGTERYFLFLRCTCVLLSAIICVSQLGFTWIGYLVSAAVTVAILWVIEQRKRLELFVCGLMAGILVGGVIVGFLPESPSYIGLIAMAVSAIIFGICAAILVDSAIIPCMAYIGGSIIAVTILFLVMNISNLSSFVSPESQLDSAINLNKYISTTFYSENAILIFVITVCLTVFSIMLQKKTGRGLFDKKEK